MADGTMIEIGHAINRLRNWLKSQHQLSLPSGLDAEIALNYRNWIYGHENGLKHSTSSKEIRYLNAVWSAAKREQLIGHNPLVNLPKNRRTLLQIPLVSK